KPVRNKRRQRRTSQLRPRRNVNNKFNRKLIRSKRRHELRTSPLRLRRHSANSKFSHKHIRSKHRHLASSNKLRRRSASNKFSHSHIRSKHRHHGSSNKRRHLKISRRHLLHDRKPSQRLHQSLRLSQRSIKLRLRKKRRIHPRRKRKEKNHRL